MSRRLKKKKAAGNSFIQNSLDDYVVHNRVFQLETQNFLLSTIQKKKKEKEVFLNPFFFYLQNIEYCAGAAIQKCKPHSGFSNLFINT